MSSHFFYPHYLPTNTCPQQHHSSSYQEVQTSGFMEQVDHLTAQLLLVQEKLAQSDATIQQQSAALAQQNTVLAQRETSLTQLETRAAQHDAKLAQKEAELQQSREKLRTLEQNVDALAAQVM